MLTDALGCGGVDYCGQRIGVGLLDAADAAEVFEQPLAGARTDAGDGVQFASRGRASRGACDGR